MESVKVSLRPQRPQPTVVSSPTPKGIHEVEVATLRLQSFITRAPYHELQDPISFQAARGDGLYTVASLHISHPDLSAKGVIG